MSGQRGEYVLVVANETEAQKYQRTDSLMFIVNVNHGARMVEGLRVDSIDITPQAAQDEKFFEVYQALRRSQIMTRR